MVQLGGLYAKNAKDPQGRRDYEAMRTKIVSLVAEPRERPSGRGEERPAAD